MTTVVAPSPAPRATPITLASKDKDKGKGKGKPAPSLEGAKLNAALASLARLESDGAPKLGPANRDTWAREVATWATTRMQLHTVIAAAPGSFSRNCADKVDRSGRDLADYLCGIRFDAKGRRADLKTWASPK